MFARIQEFATSCVKGEFFADDVESAMKSFCKGEEVSYNKLKISRLRSDSLGWLKQALASCSHLPTSPLKNADDLC
jgi:hypothetical protein